MNPRKFKTTINIQLEFTARDETDALKKATKVSASTRVLLPERSMIFSRPTIARVEEIT